MEQQRLCTQTLQHSSLSEPTLHCYSYTYNNDSQDLVISLHNLTAVEKREEEEEEEEEEEKKKESHITTVVCSS